jgi:hypothetical protein
MKKIRRSTIMVGRAGIESKTGGNGESSLAVANPSDIRVFDLFCGGGGSSCGAKKAGVMPVGGVDL